MTQQQARYLPWLLAALVLAVPILLAVTWDAAFEAIPANSETVSLGDDAIRNFKLEVRERTEEEHCWATPGTGCPVTDNGFHRTGSAACFSQNAAPTTLANPAATALAANHVGRCWVDADGADNIAANADDNRLMVWNGVTWQSPRLETVGGVVLTALATGDLIRYNGADWVNTTKAVLITRDQASFDIDETFTNGVCSADCTGAGGAVPDHTGGSDVNNYPEVTIPSTPSGVVWDVYVYGRVFYQMTSGGAGDTVCFIRRDIDDADTFPTLQEVYYLEGISNSNGLDRECIFNSVFTGAVAGSRYAFRLHMTDTGSLSADWDVNSALAPAPISSTANSLIVEARPRTLF